MTVEYKPDKNVRCDACGCAFIPEMLTQREGEIEYTFFRCDYCGKAYMVSVTDEALRKDIAKYVSYVNRNRVKRLSEKELRRAAQLKENNLKRSRELRKQYLKDTEQEDEDHE